MPTVAFISVKGRFWPQLLANFGQPLTNSGTTWYTDIILAQLVQLWFNPGTTLDLLKDPLKPISVHLFSNTKAWINSDIIKSILSRLYLNICFEKHKLVLLWSNPTCHPETFYAKIQYCDYNLLTSIIRNFKHKRRKLLVRYVVSRIDEGNSASQIIEDIYV